MKRPHYLTLKDPRVLLTTFFGAGYSPVAPGTAGTIAVIPFLILAYHYNVSLWFFMAILIFITLISSIAAQSLQKQHNVHDPGWIVVDEAIGMATTWIFAQTIVWHQLILLFALFRIFDIIKIWPASYFDKKVKHGFGTIGDDIVSGVYAGLTYLAGIKILSLLA